MSQHTLTLLLGSNLNNPSLQVERAIILLEATFGLCIERSIKLWNPAIGFESPYIFCNIVVVFNTILSPQKCLNVIKGVERKMGRLHDSAVKGKWEDRIIDIDIVFYDKINFYSKNLTIPHTEHVFLRSFSKRILSQII